MRKILLMLLVVGLTATVALEGVPEFLSVAPELNEYLAEYALMRSVIDIWSGSVDIIADGDITVIEKGQLQGIRWALLLVGDRHGTDTAYNAPTERAINAVVNYYDKMFSGEDSLVNLFKTTDDILVECIQEINDEFAIATERLEAVSPLRSEVYVKHVINGNTFHCPGLGIVRLLYVDVPGASEDGYNEATERLRDLVEGQFITLTFDVPGSELTDDEGRLQAWAVVGDVDVCTTLVAEHLAKPTELPPRSVFTDWPQEN